MREVGAATSAMLVADDVRGRLLFAARQAFDVQTLLEDAGAVVDVDLAIGDDWSPQARLRAAAEALDAVPVQLFQPDAETMAVALRSWAGEWGHQWVVVDTHPGATPATSGLFRWPTCRVAGTHCCVPAPSEPCMRLFTAHGSSKPP